MKEIILKVWKIAASLWLIWAFVLLFMTIDHRGIIHVENSKAKRKLVYDLKRHGLYKKLDLVWLPTPPVSITAAGCAVTDAEAASLSTILYNHMTWKDPVDTSTIWDNIHPDFYSGTRIDSVINWNDTARIKYDDIFEKYQSEPKTHYITTEGIDSIVIKPKR
jgi:hypothetical protein